MLRLPAFLLLLSLAVPLQSQVIKGTVFDNETKKAVAYATVYFNGTSVGVISDQDGNFSLDVTKYSYMPLTISAIGYYSGTVTVFSAEKPLAVYLVPKLFELDEVVISSRSVSRERKSNLKIFREVFLGTTPNGLKCEIMNEDDIRFQVDPDEGAIIAYALKPLIIDNRALGYKITYYLDRFEHNRLSRTFFFRGNIIFSEYDPSELTPKHLSDRDFAYKGSRMHFFRALWSDKLASEGFTVSRPGIDNLGFRDLVNRRDSTKLYLRKGKDLTIVYRNTYVSKIVFVSKDVYFESSGYFDSAGIVWEGEMATKRVGDLLPNEY